MYVCLGCPTRLMIVERWNVKLRLGSWLANADEMDRRSRPDTVGYSGEAKTEAIHWVSCGCPSCFFLTGVQR